MFKVVGIPLILMAVNVASAQTTALKDEMKTRYEVLEKAYSDRNINAITAMMQPDFYLETLDGQKSKLNAVKKSTVEDFKRTQSGTWKIEIISVTGKDPVATVNVRMTFSGFVLDPAKRPYKLDAVSTERHFWYKSNNVWKMGQETVLGQKTVVDKQAIMPNADTSTVPNAAPVIPPAAKK